jgi:ABC-type sugar transport system permease subunit
MNTNKSIIHLSPDEVLQRDTKLQRLETRLTQELSRQNDRYLALGSKDKASPLHFWRLRRINKRRSRIKHRLQRIRTERIALNSGPTVKLTLWQQWVDSFRQLPYRKQKMVFGALFVVPWVIGTMVFFLYPLSTTLWWSMNDMTPKPGGGFIQSFQGLRNYINLFTSETLAGTTVLEVLTASVLDILIDLPTILMFALFIAVLLNTKFKGHQLVKAIFFIPVVYNLTVVNNTLSGTFGQLFDSGMDQGFELSESFNSFLMQIGIGGGLVEFLMSAVDRIFLIINKSGIQIIMFLAALQSIPLHLYETAKVEGATRYEMFWKVTFPLVSPMMMTTLVYTIVDSFGSSDIMHFLTVNSQGTTMATNQPGLYSAISVVYFLVNIGILVVAFLMLRKRVFYYD